MRLTAVVTVSIVSMSIAMNTVVMTMSMRVIMIVTTRGMSVVPRRSAVCQSNR